MADAAPADPVSPEAIRAREAALYAELDRLGVAHRTQEHEAVFTVAQSAPIRARLPGGHAKTLLVEDRADLFLLAAPGQRRVDLKAAARAASAGRLRFSSEETLLATLGLRPGAVTPFALMHEAAAAIRAVVLDAGLMRCDPLWFHPLRNTASTAISPDGLRRFCGAHARAVIEAAVTKDDPGVGAG